MLDQRKSRIKKLISQRQSHFTVILENIRDPHNIGAVLRTCDAVGIREVYLINHRVVDHQPFILGKRASSGARKWVEVYEFDDLHAGMIHIRSKGYQKIWATKLLPGSKSVYELDFTQKIALLFGNEHLGVSDEALAYADGNFIIPQVGMVQSLNISVACAVTLYEGFRQRKLNGQYDQPDLSVLEQDTLYDHYVHRELLRVKGKNSIKIQKG